MKKIVSFVLATLMLSMQNNVFAGKKCPISAKERNKIRAEFKKELDSNEGDLHLPIAYELKKPTPDDNRLVMVYNMQHLMDVSDDENFIGAIMKLYSKAKEAVQKAKIEHNTYVGNDYSRDNAVNELFERLDKKDDPLKHDIQILARELGISYDETRNSYILLLATEYASKCYSENNSWKISVGAFGGLGGLGSFCLGVFGALKFAIGAAPAAHIALGVGGILLAGVAGVAGIAGGAYIANSYIQEQAKKSDVIFRIQRMQNVARLINQFGMQLVNEPESVLNSNVLVTAIDERKDSSGTKYEDKWAVWRWWNRDIKDDGSWGRFVTITDLACAPKAGDYVSSDGRSLRTLIRVFGSLMSDDVIDFERLKDYLAEPKRFERSLQAIAPSMPRHRIAEVAENEVQDKEDV